MKLRHKIRRKYTSCFPTQRTLHTNIAIYISASTCEEAPRGVSIINQGTGLNDHKAPQTNKKHIIAECSPPNCRPDPRLEPRTELSQSLDESNNALQRSNAREMCTQLLGYNDDCGEGASCRLILKKSFDIFGLFPNDIPTYISTYRALQSVHTI